MENLWSTMAKRAEPYVPGLQLNNPHIIKLNTNENAYPPSPKVIQAITEEMENLHLYPSPTADSLKEVIGEHYNLRAEEVFIGNGSDEVLAFSFMAFFEPGQKIKFPNITYSFYPVYAKLFNIPYEEIPLREDLTIDTDLFSHSEGGVILPNPNAPTSLYLEIDEIESIVKRNTDRVVIIDEAYIDFASTSAATLVRKYDNILVVQTTSKSRALAGLRVGFALGHPHLIKALIRMKDSVNSYTIDRLALEGAKAAFLDKSYFEKTTEKIINTRGKVTKQLKDLDFNVLPSATNFLFVTHQTLEASILYEQLLKENVLVRYFNQEPIDNYLRITIGSEEDMEQFIQKLTKIIKND